MHQKIAQYPRIESKGSIVTIILGIWEVQVDLNDELWGCSQGAVNRLSSSYRSFVGPQSK